MIVDYPLEMLRPADAAIALDYLNRPDQEATNGMSRAVGQSGARFKVSLIDVAVYDVATARAFRAFLGQAEGRRNLVRFGLPDVYGLDGPVSQATFGLRQQYPQGVPFSSGAFFSTGVGHHAGYRRGAIALAADLNARELFLDNCPSDIGGCYVSIEDFCYTVTGRWDTAVSGRSRIRISPVLRRAIEVGATIEYAPRFVGTLQTDSPGFEAMDRGFFGRFTLDFVEDLTRARLPYDPVG